MLFRIKNNCLLIDYLLAIYTIMLIDYGYMVVNHVPIDYF